MNLKVQLRSQLEDGSLFGALPAPVCASLAEQGIFFGVLRIAYRHETVIYVGWGGASCPIGSIGLDRTFAGLLHIPSNALVRVTLATSLESTNIPSHLAADTVAITPFYDGSNSAQREMFSALAAAVNALELGLMQQIRVLHEHLCFPIMLPGNRSISVRVDNVTASSSQTNANPPYVVLVPDSKIIVSPPPLLERKSIASLFCAVLRVLPVPADLRQAFATRAFVSPELGDYFQTEDASFICTYLSVANKGEVGRSLALPVATCANEQVPPGHIFVPRYICNALAIPLLTPIRVEESSEYSSPPSSFRVTADYKEWALSDAENEGSSIASVYSLQALQVPTIVFPGIVFGNVCVSSANPSKGLEKSHLSKWSSSQRATELWDREWNEKSDRELDAQVRRTYMKSQDVDSKEQDPLISVPAWFLCPNLKVKLIKSPGDEASVSGPNRDLNSDENLGYIETVRLSRIPGEFSRSAIFGLLLEAQKLFMKKKNFSDLGMPDSASACSLVALEGAPGSGKTFVLRRVTALLREKAKARTVWIRCQLHKGEPEHATIRRINSAFKAATHGGPGVVVFDNADVFFSHAGKNAIESRQEDNAGAVASRRKLAQCIIRSMAAYQNEQGGSVLVLIACTKAQNLDLRLRVPAVIANVIQLNQPSPADRAAVLMFQSFPHLDVATSKVRYAEEEAQRQLLYKVASLTEGFGPKDLAVLAERTNVQVRIQDSTDSSGDIHPAIALSEMAKLVSAMTPMSRRGIRFDASSEGEIMNWDDIAGLKEAKNVIKEILELPAQYPDLFSNAPIRQKRGILLYGPPGCGKTALAAAAASACGMRKICIRGPELLRKYIGESEAEVRRVFERAAAVRPCVIIFDEFDSLAPRRGGESTGVADRVVNTLLTALDGVEELAKGVFVIATTSRPESIDPALLRPGRLDVWVAVDLPKTVEDRIEILTSICRSCDANLSAEMLHSIANQTDGYSGADLKGVVVELELVKKRLLERHTGPVDEPFVQEALRTALAEARPSISASMRKKYKQVMSKFDRRKGDDVQQTGKASDVAPYDPSAVREVLRRVALQ